MKKFTHTISTILALGLMVDPALANMGPGSSSIRVTAPSELFRHEATVPPLVHVHAPIISCPARTLESRGMRVNFELRRLEPLLAKPEDSEQSWHATAKLAEKALREDGIDLGSFSSIFVEIEQGINTHLQGSSHQKWDRRKNQVKLLSELFYALGTRSMGIRFIGTGVYSESRLPYVAVSFNSSDGPMEAVLAFREGEIPFLKIVLESADHRYEEVDIGADPPSKGKKRTEEFDHGIPHWDFRVEIDDWNLSWLGHVPVYGSDTSSGLKDNETQQAILAESLKRLRERVIALGMEAVTVQEGNASPVAIPRGPLRDPARVQQQFKALKAGMAKAINGNVSRFRSVSNSSLRYLLVSAIMSCQMDMAAESRVHLLDAIEHSLAAANLMPDEREKIASAMPTIIDSIISAPKAPQNRVWVLYEGRLPKMRYFHTGILPKWATMNQYRSDMRKPKVLLPYYGPSLSAVAELSRRLNIPLDDFISDTFNGKQLREWFDRQIQGNQRYEPTLGRLSERYQQHMRRLYGEDGDVNRLLLEHYFLASNAGIPCRTVEPPYEIWRASLQAVRMDQFLGEALARGDIEAYFDLQRQLTKRLSWIFRFYEGIFLFEIAQEQALGNDVILPLSGEYWKFIERLGTYGYHWLAVSTANQPAQAYSGILARPQDPGESKADFELRMLRTMIASMYDRTLHEGTDVELSRRVQLLTECWDRNNIVMHLELVRRIKGKPELWHEPLRQSLVMFLQKAARGDGRDKPRRYFEEIAQRLDVEALRRFQAYLNAFPLPTTSAEVPDLMLRWLEKDGHAHDRGWISPYDLEVLQGRRREWWLLHVEDKFHKWWEGLFIKAEPTPDRRLLAGA